MLEERKQQIRRKLKPGNSKTTWDAVNIARDNETSQIPKKMHLQDEIINKEDQPESFANFFKTKIINLAYTCSTLDNVY